VAAYLVWPLSLTTYCDFSQSYTFTAPVNPVDFTGATAVMQIRVTPEDPNPVISLSSTPSTQGAVYLGVAPPGPFGETVADVAALAAYDTTDVVSGTIFYVVAGPAWYAWDPGGVQIPDGVTIVAGDGGNWLLCGTIVINIKQAAMPALQGVSKARYNVLVTFSNGTTSNYMEGPVYTDQSVTQE
jgi:hypothetical protein